MEVIDFLKPQVLLQSMQYSHVDLHVTAQLMSGCPGREREEYLPALSFHSKSRQAEKHCGIPTKQLGRTCLSLTKQSSGNSPVFQAAPAPQHKRCSTRNQRLRLLFDRNGMELHYNRVCWGKGMNPCPVCFMGTLSPITEKLAASSCAELCAQPGQGQACQGVCCLSTENGTLWRVAGVDLWLLSAASPHYGPSSSPKLFLPFVFLFWADVPYSLSSIDIWVSRNRNIELDELFQIWVILWSLQHN